MFNSKFNLTEALFDLPFNIRKKVMYSMVGSANARIFNTADKATEKLLADGYEHDTLKMLTQPELVALTASVDDTDSFATAKIMYGLATEWRDKLQEDADNETEGNLGETIKFMVGKQKMKSSDAAGVKRLASLGIKRSPEEKLATLRKDLETANRVAAEKTIRLGFTEFLIDRVIANNGGSYEELPENVKEALCAKYIESLTKAELSAIENEELGRTYAGNLSASDIVLIRDIKATAMAEIDIPRPKTADNGLPGPNAVRVRASSESKANIVAERKHAAEEKDFADNYQMEAALES